MNERPSLTTELNAQTFRQYYYLKEELVEFCRKNDLQTTGSKTELAERIAIFLESIKTDGCTITVNAYSYTVITAHKWL